MNASDRIGVIGSRAGLVALALAALPAAALGAEWRAPNVGGPGGGPFAGSCASGYLVGLEVRAGDLVDAVRPLCADAVGQGVSRDYRRHSRAYGGDGGTALTLHCPPRLPVVMHIEPETRPPYLRGMFVFCGSLSRTPVLQRTGLWLGAEMGTQGSVMNQPRLTCPSGMAGVGVHGRHGKWVDSLGLICRTIR